LIFAGSQSSFSTRLALTDLRRAVELAQPTRRKAIIKDIHEVMRVMQNSPTAAYLRECSFHERMMLAALVKCIKREGVDEIKWGEVCYSVNLSLLLGGSTKIGVRRSSTST
jgi:origin recognition complex subunit 1